MWTSVMRTPASAMPAPSSPAPYAVSHNPSVNHSKYVPYTPALWPVPSSSDYYPAWNVPIVNRLNLCLFTDSLILFLCLTFIKGFNAAHAHLFVFSGLSNSGYVVWSIHYSIYCYYFLCITAGGNSIKSANRLKKGLLECFSNEMQLLLFPCLSFCVHTLNTHHSGNITMNSNIHFMIVFIITYQINPLLCDE